MTIMSTQFPTSSSQEEQSLAQVNTTSSPLDFIPAESSQESSVEQVAQQPVTVPSAPVNLTSTKIPPITKKSLDAVVNDWIEVTGIPDADRVLKGVPPAHQVGIQRLMEYAVKMNPTRPIDSTDGAKLQASLFRIIQNVINREDTYFRQIFTAILAIFTHDKSGAFKEVNVYRFMDNIPINDIERKAFVRLLNMIRLLGPKEGRSVALKQIDMTQTLQFGLTDNGRQKVLNFFNVSK
jgi:hypothetical protein